MANILVSHLGKAIDQLSMQISSKTSSTSPGYEVSVKISATGRYVSQHGKPGNNRIQAEHLATHFDSADVQEQVLALEEEERECGVIGLGISIQEHCSTVSDNNSIDEDSAAANHRQQILATLADTVEEEDDTPRLDDTASAPAPYEAPIALTNTEQGYPIHPRPSHKASDIIRSSTRTRKRHGHVDRQDQVFLISPISYSSSRPPVLSTMDYASNSSMHGAHPMRKQHGHPDRSGIADLANEIQQ
jgi:hypothetical protein